MLTIRSASSDDYDSIWAILDPVIRAGEVFALPRTMSKEAALAYWTSPAHEVFVAEQDGQLVGTYYIRPNQQGGGSHVANCGYLTSPAATGRGVARAMCAHSLVHAKDKGYRAMQFNFVVSTNERAVCLWQSFGFKILATLPGAFEHPLAGFTDAYVMFRAL
jgi:ribosomal protein S18 acetylase RimI-like enzyme